MAVFTGRQRKLGEGFVKIIVKKIRFHLVKNFLLTFGLTAILTLSYGQSKNIQGQVVDSVTSEPIAFVSVSLSNALDSNSKAFSITNQKGTFTFSNSGNEDYILVFAYVGYAVLYISKDDFEKLPNGIIHLSPKTYTYAEFVITANKIPILFNGDSIVYNAESFKTRENADVEELLRKLPGVQVGKDGSIQVEGGNVTKILVNGKEFFGGNLAAATKNLDAKMVDKIQVIDRDVNEDELEKNDGQREKVINVVLKKQYNQGYFGSVSAGLGLNNQHDVKANMNFFREKQHLTIITGKNNINNRVFGWEEIRSLNNFAINPLNSWSSMNYTSGILSPLGIGINMHSEFSQKLKIDISTIYSDDKTDNRNISEAEVYLDAGTLFNNGINDRTTNNQSQQYNVRLEYNPDSLTTITLRAKYEKIDATTNAVGQNVNYLQNGTVVNSALTLSDELLNNYRINTKLHWSRSMRKNKQHKFMGSLYFGQEQKDEQFLSFFDRRDNEILRIPEQYNPILGRFLNTESKTLAFTSSFQISLPKKAIIRPGINGMTTNYSHNFQWEEQNILVPSNSPVGQVQSNKLEYYMHFSMPIDSFLKLYIVPEFTQIIEERKFTTTTENSFNLQNFFFTPHIYVMGNKPQKYNMYAGIYSDVGNPQIQQFIPATDNSSPFRVRVGDITLNNNANYNSYYRYNKIFGLKRSFAIFGNANYSINPIITDFNVDENNVATLTYLNARYRLSSYSQVKYTYPFEKIKALISHQINYGYSENYSKRNGSFILSQSQNTGASFEIQFNEFKKWDATASYHYNLQFGKIDKIDNNLFSEQNISLNLGFNFSERLTANATTNVRVLGANETSNQIIVPIISGGLTYIVDKKNRWSIGIRSFDLLNKNQQIWRYWGENQFTSNTQVAIQRYVLFNVTYRIKKKDKKPAEDNIIID